jgi:Histidine kinase-, DNA gyrase B-, and HSP90-like ATPase
VPKIKVHEKALAHLSRGLYRSPASAIRELVSNAWDANATVVRINTNYPNFFQLSVQDNGEGFTKNDFKILMEGGIGNSEKRNEESPLTNDRPVIGRLGIGLLGIAQICGAFTVTSRTREGEGFRARVNLYDLLKEKLDKDDPAIIKELETVRESSEPAAGDEEEYGVREVDIGEYTFDRDFDPTSVRRGTTIITDDIHPTFVQTFKESLNKEAFPKFKDPPSDWSKALTILSKVHSLQELGDYWRLLWELSAACPIPYVNDRALPRGVISEDQKRLESYNFKVLVDGIELFKPVSLHRNPGGYTTRVIGPHATTIYGKSLAFHGYLVVQEGRQLLPDELRGISVRIKNVGIGYYDPSMLDYRFNEGPRSRWLTGEIYVDQGLEDALNIDRDSFNRFHPQFRYVQSYIHNILHSEIFPAVYKNIDARSLEKKEAKSKEHKQHLRSILSDATEKSVRVKQARDTTEEEFPLVHLDEDADLLEITVPDPTIIKTKKTYRDLASAVLTIHEIALREKTRDKQRRLFTELLLRLLAEW